MAGVKAGDGLARFLRTSSSTQPLILSVCWLSVTKPSLAYRSAEERRRLEIVHGNDERTAAVGPGFMTCEA